MSASDEIEVFSDIGILTTDEAKHEVTSGTTVVLLPIGSIGPDGPHLPLGTDCMISETTCDRAVMRLEEDGIRTFVAPTIPYGVTDFAAGFSGAISIPPAALTAYLRAVADRVDQVAIMTYDSYAPTEALAGRYFAWQTERVLSLIGDRVTVFMGVPTYRSPTPWAENLPTALRGVRQGVERLRRRPRRPFGVAVYAEWTTNHHDWDTFRQGWRDSGR